MIGSDQRERSLSTHGEARPVCPGGGLVLARMYALAYTCGGKDLQMAVMAQVLQTPEAGTKVCIPCEERSF
jgi:hypothetical protein